MQTHPRSAQSEDNQIKTRENWNRNIKFNSRNTGYQTAPLAHIYVSTRSTHAHMHTCTHAHTCKPICTHPSSNPGLGSNIYKHLKGTGTEEKPTEAADLRVHVRTYVLYAPANTLHTVKYIQRMYVCTSVECTVHTYVCINTIPHIQYKCSETPLLTTE